MDCVLHACTVQLVLTPNMGKGRLGEPKLVRAKESERTGGLDKGSGIIGASAYEMAWHNQHNREFRVGGITVHYT